MVEQAPVRTWSRTDAAVFCRVRELHGDLSNMAMGHPFDDADGVRWTSSEAWYQAQRFPHRPDLREKVRGAANAFMAKQVAYEHIGETRPDWDAVKAGMMLEALRLKLQSQRFRLALEATGDLQIVELSLRDKNWGAQPKGDVLVGRNLLGLLLMQVRAEMRAAAAKPAGAALGKPRGK